MASNKYYIAAGLQPSKVGATTPTAGVNTYYIAAGLPPLYIAAAGGATTMDLERGFIRSSNRGYMRGTA